MFITAIGHYVPKERVGNDYFLSINGLESEWIEQRTGILSRSKAAENENANTMGIEACEVALENLSFDKKEIDLVVAASYSPYDTVATLAHIVQRKYNMTDAKAVYLSSACSSLVNGLELIEGYFAMGKASKALLICSEHNTYYSNPSDPKAGHLWGDAAVAMVITKDQINSKDPQILEVFTRGLGHIGKGPEGVILRPKEGGIEMPDGRDVFMNACNYMVEALDNVTSKHSMTTNDLDYIICHQANMRIVANVARQLKRESDVFLNNIKELGNTGSASTGLVLSQNYDKFKSGDSVAMCVFGGGYSSGSVLIKF